MSWRHRETVSQRSHPYSRHHSKERPRHSPSERQRRLPSSVVQERPPVFVTNDDVHGAVQFELEKNKSDYYLYRYISDFEHEYVVDTSSNQVSNMAIVYTNRKREELTDPHHSSHFVQGYKFKPCLTAPNCALNWYPVPRQYLSERTIKSAWRHRTLQEAFRCKQSFTAFELSQLHVDVNKLRASDVVEVQYPAYVSGLQWHVCPMYPTSGIPLDHPELSYRLVDKMRRSPSSLRFTADEWSSLSLNTPLTMNHFVVGNGVVFQPGFGDEDKNPRVFYRPHLEVERRDLSFAIFSLDQALRTYNMPAPGTFDSLEIRIDRYETEEEFFLGK